MTYYYREELGFTGAITVHRDNTATPRIWSGHGQLVHHKRHANKQAAYAAWRRWFQ